MKESSTQTEGSSPAAKSSEVPALDLALRPLRALLDDPEINELCINRPGEGFVRSASGWTREVLPFADFLWCRRLAKLAANWTRQRIDETTPLLSAVLASGEKLQVVMPPATMPECVAITFTRPPDGLRSLEELAASDAFRHTRSLVKERQTTAREQELDRLFERCRYEEFVRLAVQCGQNILVSGPPGAGKTTWMNALLREIPGTERLVVIDEAQGILKPSHPNHVRLLCRDDRGAAHIGQKLLLETSLRLRPERVVVMELSGGEAFDFLKLSARHRGILTSVCASSIECAFEQLSLMVKQSSGGGYLPRDEVRSLLESLIDVVVQCGTENHRRVVTQIWYRRHASK